MEREELLALLPWLVRYGNGRAERPGGTIRIVGEPRSTGVRVQGPNIVVTLARPEDVW